jgi:UDP-N-acetylmuramoyl-L-alanyl-D-glutamate--2,6-diaminopimelate ligase
VPDQPRATNLAALVQALDPPVAMPAGAETVTVTGVASDTRRLAPGDLFVAQPGDHTHGARFIREAVRLGAPAVVTEEEPEGALPVPIVRVPDARAAVSRLAAEFWGRPSRELRVIGVTGTDGKTTTTFMSSAVLEAGGHTTGYISTVDVKLGPRRVRNLEHATTPQAPELQRRLREMVDAGVTHVVVESSSHGLKLRRLEDVAYDVAVLTNVTSEHLELHGTVEQYRLDKARLFTLMNRHPKPGVRKVGIVNADDPNADMYLRAAAGPTLTFGTYRYADLVGEDIAQGPDGLRFRVRSDQHGTAEARLPVLGAYNVYNALAALCVGLTQDVPLAQGLAGLERFEGVPGRMERVDEGQSFAVVVDYAHTADSLRKVLAALRAAARGRLIAVFGSAGERDRAKRPEMGAVAARHADFFILTDEDPRAEDGAVILREIAAGAEAEGARDGERYLCIPDRREAIREALRRARPRDVVLLAGKGHESTIEYADGPVPWNEEEVARELLRAL